MTVQHVTAQNKQKFITTEYPWQYRSTAIGAMSTGERAVTVMLSSLAGVCLLAGKTANPCKTGITPKRCRGKVYVKPLAGVG